MVNSITLGSHSGDTDVSAVVPARYIWAILALAITARGLVLLLNIHWNIPPYWEALPRTALMIARSDFGKIPLSAAFENTFHMTVKEALEMWPFDDRGVIYLFVLAQKIFGRVSYLHIQILNLAIDALMVLPVVSIARRIAGPGAAIAAGIAYALFLPEIQVAAAPDYNSWLTYSLIVMTWISMKVFVLPFGFFSARLWLLIGGLIVANVVANEFRSISILFAVAAAGWLGFVSMIERRSLTLPAWRWQQIAALLLAGTVTIFAAAETNNLVRGEFSPVRSSFGHSFWSGVGQFANPYGLIEDDGVVAEFYKRETGRTDSRNTTGVKYNAWLTKRAFKFIEEYPGLYASMVVRRALKIIFPNMAFTAVADLPSFTRLPDQKRLIKRRKELVAKYGWASWNTFSELISISPEYVLSLIFRVILLLALPVGIFAALVMAPSKPRALMACLPLAYIIITLSGYYVTPVVITTANSATLPVAAAGWFLVLSRLMRHFRRS